MKTRSLLTLAVLATSCFLTRTAAADTNASTQDSIDQMKRLMVTPSERNAAIAKDPAALEADQKAGAIGGPAAKQKIYEIAADIAGTMASKDPEGFGNSADSLKSTDPQKLYNSLTQEQKDAIRRLANEIENAHK